MGDAPDFNFGLWADVKPCMGMGFPNLPFFIDGDFKLTETVAIH